MVSNKAIGRPPKVNYRVILKLVDAIQHNASVTEATRFAGISRQTYYHYLNKEPVFAKKMAIAKENQNKAVFSFLTVRLFN